MQGEFQSLEALIGDAAATEDVSEVELLDDDEPEVQEIDSDDISIDEDGITQALEMLKTQKKNEMKKVK